MNSLLRLRANATPLLRGLLSLTDRVGFVSIPLPDLARPNYTPISVLPWLAWGLCVDRWPQGEVRQRQIVTEAIPTHKRRGSRKAMDLLLAEYDGTLTLTEWWEEGGSGDPFTFRVTLPVNGAQPDHVTGTFMTGLMADIERTKPARALFEFRQLARASVRLPFTVAARTMTMVRSLAPIAQPDPADLLKLTTEYGEPLEGPDGIAWEYG